MNFVRGPISFIQAIGAMQSLKGKQGGHTHVFKPVTTKDFVSLPALLEKRSSTWCSIPSERGHCFVKNCLYIYMYLSVSSFPLLFVKWVQQKKLLAGFSCHSFKRLILMSYSCANTRYSVPLPQLIDIWHVKFRNIASVIKQSTLINTITL